MAFKRKKQVSRNIQRKRQKTTGKFTRMLVVKQPLRITKDTSQRAKSMRTAFKKKNKGFTSTNLSEISTNNFTVVLHKKRPKHNTGQWNYIQSQPNVFGSASGLQAVTDGGSMGSVAQLNTSTGLGYTNFQGMAAIQQLNPYLSTTGSTVYPTQAIPLTDRYLLKTYNMRTEYTSWNNIAQTGWIYYVTPKRNTRTGPTSAWLAGNVALASGKAQQTFPATPATTGSLGGESPNYPYSTPLTSPTFKDLYKVLKVTKLHLPAGATKTINARFIVNKIIQDVVVEQAVSEGNLFLKDITVITLAVWMGQVVKDETIGVVGTPVFGKTQVGAISLCEYTCSAVDGNAGRLSNNIAVTNIPTGASLINLHEINDDTGLEEQMQEL